MKTIKYEVRFTCYKYNTGAGDNGTYTCKRVFEEPLPATQYADYVKISIMSRDEDWINRPKAERSERIARDVDKSYVNGYDGIYEVVTTEREITLEKIEEENQELESELDRLYAEPKITIDKDLAQAFLQYKDAHDAWVSSRAAYTVHENTYPFERLMDKRTVVHKVNKELEKTMRQNQEKLVDARNALLITIFGCMLVYTQEQLKNIAEEK